ncbi:MAG: hypothetical protein QXY84_06660 [Candidatus Caldarchaeum sp.]
MDGLEGTFLGDRVEYTLAYDQYRLKYREPPDFRRNLDSKIMIEFIPDKVIVVPR